jgi:hypothetical protein
VSAGGAPPGALAVAALSFPVADGARVGTLSLGLGGLKPATVSIIACPVTGPFRPVENGPLSDVPPFDCSTSEVATLSADGASIGFTHLAAMVRGGSLSIVLLGRPAAVASASGFHRFARERTGPAPRV